MYSKCVMGSQTLTCFVNNMHYVYKCYISITLVEYKILLKQSLKTSL